MSTNPPKHASPDDAREAAQHWDDTVLECRTYNHDWRPVTAAYSKDRRAILTVQVCQRCECEKRSTLDSRNGEILTSHIAYVDGYLLKGVGRMFGDARGALRLEAVQRLYGFKLTRARRAS